MQENDGCKFHGFFILSFCWMPGVAGEEIQGMGEERKHGAERALGSGGAAGKIEDERAACDAADASAEG